MPCSDDMTELSSSPPYFEQLLARLEARDPATTAAFGRHVHWGYWEQSVEEVASAEEYGQAAEQLCLAVLDRADISDGKRVLDVGCGFGGTIACLNDRYADLHLTGLNIDPRQLERARSLIVADNSNVIEFVEGDAAELPFADGSFDGVLAVECAFHFDRERFLAEVGRVLRPGGTLAISDFVPSERAVEYIEAMNLESNESVRWAYGKIDLTWSVSRYRDYAVNCGMTLVETRDITANTLPTYAYLEASVKGWMEEADLEKFLKATKLLEKASRRGLIGYQILKFEKA
jgi:SAM-dependent methyltransferase